MWVAGAGKRKNVSRTTVEAAWLKGVVLYVDREMNEMLVYCHKDKTYGWLHTKCDTRLIGMVGGNVPSEGMPLFEAPKYLVYSKKVPKRDQL